MRPLSRPLERHLRPGVRLLPGLVALCVFAAAGCTEAAPLEEWTLQAEQIQVLGDDPVDAASGFYQPTDLAFDSAGRLYVLDSGNHRIQVFDDGKLVSSLGRRGAGPGELSQPEGFWVFPDGEIVVADTGNRRLQRFGPSGESIDTVAVEYLPIDVVGTDRHLFVLRLPPPAMIIGPDHDPLVYVLDRDGNSIDGFIDPASEQIGMLFFLRNTLRIAASPGGGFAVADTHVYSRIRRYRSDGSLQAELPVLYKAQAWAPLGRLPRKLNEQTLARIARTATDLWWDAQQGLYWVLSGTVDRAADGRPIVAREIYRYRPDGTYQGSIMLPFRGLALATSPDHTLWVLDVDGAAHRFRLHDPEPVDSS